MAGPYSRFGSGSEEYFRQLITGGDIDMQPEETPGIMSRSRFAGRSAPEAILTTPDQPEAPDMSLFENFAKWLGRSSDDPNRVADAVLRDSQPVRPTGALDEYDMLPPLESITGARQDQTREALGSAPDPINLEGSTRGATPVSQQQEPSVEETPVEAATEESTFSSVTNNLYEAFTVGGQEGTEAHVGLDAQNITLPAGIVADGLVYNGQIINAGENTIPASSFDRSLLDTSGAYKTIGTGDNAVTIRRSDYDSDQDFSRAVIAEFENRARTAAGDNWDNIPQDAQEALVKVGWNLGPNWYNGSSANTLYEELSSDTPDVSRINSSILRASTVQGGGASIGIAKARADAYNAARGAFNGSEITRIVADNTGTNTAFNYYDAEGNLVHREQTSRAVGLYENRQTEISKNSSGAW